MALDRIAALLTRDEVTAVDPPWHLKVLLRERRIANQSGHEVLLKRGGQAGVSAFSSQDLRCTFISGLLASGVDISTVQRLAGHCSVLTTQRYDRRSETSQRGLARMLEVPAPTAGGAAHRGS